MYNPCIFAGSNENEMIVENLNRCIESTLLIQTATSDDIKSLCQEAVENNFFGVCVPPYFINNAKQALTKSDVKLITVAGFPLGYQPVTAKIDEIKRYLDVIDEIDVVVNIAAIKSQQWEDVQNEIETITTFVQLRDKLIKIIIETAVLTDEELTRVCEICAQCGVDFIKTSTGFADRGASIKDITRIREIVGDRCEIKASGGIKDRSAALSLIQAGAIRIGTSSAKSMI